MEEFKYYQQSQQQQFHHSLIQSRNNPQNSDQPPLYLPHQQPPQTQQQHAPSSSSTSSSSSSTSSSNNNNNNNNANTTNNAATITIRGLNKINEGLVRCNMNGSELSLTINNINILGNLNDQNQDHMSHQYVNGNNSSNNAAVRGGGGGNNLKQLGNQNENSGKNSSVDSSGKNNSTKTTLNSISTNSVVYAMDRLSPYERYEDARNHQHNNMPNMSLEQIFKANGGNSNGINDNPNLMIVNQSDANLLLLNQNLECLKQYNNSSNSNNNNNSNNNSTANNQQQQQQQQQQTQHTNSGTNSTNSNLTNLSSLDGASRHITSSPASTSPSSSNDTGSNYGSTMSSSILNGTLTPPPDSGENGMHQLLDCNHNQSGSNHQSIKQQSNMHRSGTTSSNNSNQMESPNLVSLVPVASSSSSMLISEKASSSSSISINTMLQQQQQQACSSSNNNSNSMMNMMSPSKPSNISELSNSSLISSGSSGSNSSDSSSILTTKNSSSNSVGTPKRTRTSKPPNPDSQKDGKYFERRKRNNVAAKKSRDARKQREDEIAIRASFLEKENSILKAQLQTLKDEAQQLRILLAQKKSAAAGTGGANLQGVINPSCANCSNCSALAVAAAQAVSKSNNLSLVSNSSYLSPNNLAQLTGFESHSDLDTKSHLTLTNLTSNPTTSLVNGSLYPQQRHQIF